MDHASACKNAPGDVDFSRAAEAGDRWLGDGLTGPEPPLANRCGAAIGAGADDTDPSLIPVSCVVRGGAAAHRTNVLGACSECCSRWGKGGVQGGKVVSVNSAYPASLAI